MSSVEELSTSRLDDDPSDFFFGDDPRVFDEQRARAMGIPGLEGKNQSRRSERDVQLSDEEAKELAVLAGNSESHQTDEFSDADVTETVASLLNPAETASNRETINQLIAWATEHPRERIGEIERKLAESLEGHSLTLSALVLLGELQPYRQGVSVDKSLAERLELQETRNVSLVAQIQAVTDMNKPEYNRLMMKVWDFAREYIFTVQNEVEDDLESRFGYYGRMGWSLCTTFFQIADEDMSLAKNYLVQKILQEIRDAQYPDDGYKKGSLSGTAGGALDENIYVFQHVQESYQNRLALGINEGYPITQPVLAIAPGYYGMYQNGRIKKVFTAADYDADAARARQEAYLTQNDPADEAYGIYKEINEPIALTGQFRHPSNKLNRLRNIWDFEDQVKDSGRTYFYDVSQIDHDILHPLVDADFVTRNTTYMHQVEGEGNRATPIDEKELGRLLSPAHELGKEGREAYLNLTSLHMRKKVEEDFGINLAECSFWTQRVFLAFLENQDIKSVEEVQHVTRKFGADGLTAFLALENESEEGINENARTIFVIADSLPRDVAVAVLKKFAELVRASEGAREYLEANYPDSMREKSGVQERIVLNVLQKGKDLLKKAADGTTGEGEILAQLERCAGDLLIFANAFREFPNEESKELAIEHTPGGELSQSEYDQMLLMAARNWEGLQSIMPKMAEQIMHDVPNQLKGLDPETGAKLDTTWHLMKRGDTVLGGFRLDTLGPDAVYFGSMNTLPDLHGYKLGDAIMRQMLARETEGKVTTAHASLKTSICRSYINTYGFVGTGLEPYHETGEKLLAIEKDSRSEGGGHYQLQGKRFEDLESLRGTDGIELLEYRFEGGLAGEEYDRLLHDAEARFKQGMVMSAFVAEPVSGTGTVRYLVGYEPKANGTSEEPSPR